MMLLQAGQLGLSRRDSIWTDEIPPEMVSGATLWIDATDTSTLFTARNSGVGVTTDGQGVGFFQNNVNALNGAQASSFEPKLKLGATPSGQSSARFSDNPGLSQHLSVVAKSNGAVFPFSSLITSSTKLIFAAVKVQSSNIHQVDSPWSDDYIVSDEGSYTGLHVSDDGSALSVWAYNYSGGASVTVSRPLPRGEFAIVTMSHQSGTLRCRVNGGAWASAASGTTDSVSGIASMCGWIGSGDPTVMELAHIATFNTAQTDAAISAVEHWLALDVGITPWW